MQPVTSTAHHPTATGHVADVDTNSHTFGHRQPTALDDSLRDGGKKKTSGLRGLLQTVSIGVRRFLRRVLGSAKSSRTTPIRAVQGGIHTRRDPSCVDQPEATLSAICSGELIPAVHVNGETHSGSATASLFHDEPETSDNQQGACQLETHDQSGLAASHGDFSGQALQAPIEDVAALRHLLANVKAARSMAAGQAPAPARPQARSLQSTVQMLYAAKSRSNRNRWPPLDSAAFKALERATNGMPLALPAHLHSNSQDGLRSSSSPR